MPSTGDYGLLSPNGSAFAALKDKIRTALSEETHFAEDLVYGKNMQVFIKFQDCNDKIVNFECDDGKIIKTKVTARKADQRAANPTFLVRTFDVWWIYQEWGRHASITRWNHTDLSKKRVLGKHTWKRTPWNLAHYINKNGDSYLMRRQLPIPKITAKGKYLINEKYKESKRVTRFSPMFEEGDEVEVISIVGDAVTIKPSGKVDGVRFCEEVSKDCLSSLY